MNRAIEILRYQVNAVNHALEQKTRLKLELLAEIEEMEKNRQELYNALAVLERENSIAPGG